MRQYTPSGDEQPHQMPISLLEKPYLNMMLVKCDVILSIDLGSLPRTATPIETQCVRQFANGIMESSQNGIKNG
jgi:hypothetical protein